MVLKNDVWIADLIPVIGREQAGLRPVLVISDTAYNRLPSGLCIILPLTTRDRKIPFHCRIDPPEGGLKKVSYILCEQIRSISVERLIKKTGRVSESVMDEVEIILKTILGI